MRSGRGVNPTMTPSGVEQAKCPKPIASAASVNPTMTPSGVEQLRVLRVWVAATE